MNIDIDDAIKEAFQNAHRIKTALMEAEWDVEYYDEAFEIDFNAFTNFLINQDNPHPLSFRVAALKAASDEFTSLVFLEDQKNINTPQDIRDAHNELITDAEHHLQVMVQQMQRIYTAEQDNIKSKKMKT